MITKEYKSLARTLAVMLVLTASVFLSVPVMAEDVFADLAGMSHVESTYVSGRFAHNKKYWYSNSGMHTMDLSRGFSSLYSYQCYSEEAVTKARDILKKYLKKNPEVEVVMKTTQGMQEYVVYEKFIDEGKKVEQMIIWNCDAPNVCEIVVINWDKGLERGTARYSDEDIPESVPSTMPMNFGNFNLESLASLGETLGVEIAESIGTVFSDADWSFLENYDWESAFKGIVKNEDKE